MFGQVLAYETVHVLVRAALPGSIRMGEIEIQVEFSGNRFVLRELLAVVGGQGVRVIGEGAQLLKDGLRDVIGRAPFDLLQQGQSRFAFVERDDGLLSAPAREWCPLPNPRSAGVGPRRRVARRC